MAIVKSSPFLFGLNGTAIAGYRVEEKPGEFTLAYSEKGTCFYVKKSPSGTLLLCEAENRNGKLILKDKTGFNPADS